MDDPAVVRVRDRIGYRDHVRDQRQALVDALAFGDYVAERTTRDELHRVERRAVGPTTCLVDGNDTGMLEASRDQRLAEEPHLAAIAALEKLLERYIAAELFVAGSKNATESAAAMLGDDLVAVTVPILERSRHSLARRCGRVDTGDARSSPRLVVTTGTRNADQPASGM